MIEGPKLNRPQPRPVEGPSSEGVKDSQPTPSQARTTDPASLVDFGRQAEGRRVTDPGGDGRQTGAFRATQPGAGRVASRYNLGDLDCANELDTATAAQLRGMLSCIEDPTQRDRAVEALNAWTALF